MLEPDDDKPRYIAVAVFVSVVMYWLVNGINLFMGK
jgi:hypothetical protein